MSHATRSNFKRAPVTGAANSSRNNVIASLRATALVETKSALPAGMSLQFQSKPFPSRANFSNTEIISLILDYLPISDQMRFARTSRRMQEMVYEDPRWVKRLKSMACWDEREARARFEEGMRRKAELQRQRQLEEAKVAANGTVPPVRSSMLFDAGIEEKNRQSQESAAKGTSKGDIVDGFETLSLTGTPTKKERPSSGSIVDPTGGLKVFSNVRSIRGQALKEFGRIYGTLAPYYENLVAARSHTDPMLFRAFRDPEEQAQMLANLLRFSKSDWAEGWQQKEAKLNQMVGIFENAVLREFEQGFEMADYDGRVKRYAQVLHILNGGQAGIELFVQQNPIFVDRDRYGHSMDCINHASAGTVTLEPSREFFETLSKAVNEQMSIIERVFPPPSDDVRQQLLEKVSDEIIMEYVTPLFDESHERSVPSYLKAVSGIFEQSIQFARSVTPGKSAGEDFNTKITEMLGKVFEPHIDLYLQDELDDFKRQASSEVNDWEKKLSEQDATTESLLMATVNKQADKSDFMSSFKKVVMMPVNVLPGIPRSSPFATAKPAAQSSNGRDSVITLPSRPETPSIAGDRSSVASSGEAPSSELAAKAAIMARKLEGIKSLFSLEVALNLVHFAKTSLARASPFVSLGGQTGEEAREQCLAVFVNLLSILGSRHVQPGFDKAVTHLSNYNPREVSEHSKNGVAPLVTFLELVNVGDLISQMIDVFYEQQLCAPKLADRNDFLDPAVKAKKKFEQMLDERVAAGLNKGIDVLMDEVEYVLGTTQLPTDYNPPPNASNADVGPTAAAQQVVDLVSSHTRMLTGSTDKTMLDVFNGEVGVRLFAAICKHLKRSRISNNGSIKLIADTSIYYGFVKTLKNSDLLQYFKALRELSQIYLIDGKDAKEMAAIIADTERFGGVFRAEEVYEFAERRADWFVVKPYVERAMYGYGCVCM